MRAVLKKIIVTQQDILYLSPRQRRTFLVDIGTEFLLTFKPNIVVLKVIDANSILLPHQNPGIFFFIGRLPVIIKIETPNGIAATLDMFV